MALPTKYRSLYPALIPPGAHHVNGVQSAGPITSASDVMAAAVSSSLLSDFYVRTIGLTNLYGHVFESIPLPPFEKPNTSIVELFLRLNCLSDAYASLWEQITGKQWDESTPIRNAVERLHAQVRIDVGLAQLFGVTADELRMIYRTQFPVMRKYDLTRYFDRDGKLVPSNLLKSNPIGPDNASPLILNDPHSGITRQFNPPFRPFNRGLEMQKNFIEICKYEVR